MRITEKDRIEIERIKMLTCKIDRNDLHYFDLVTDEIYRHQPFLLSIFLEYRFDLNPEQHDEAIKIMILIWEFYKENPNINNTKLTEDRFEKIQQKNIYLLKYLEGEQNEEDKQKIIASGLSKVGLRALLAGVFFRFNHQKPLLELPWQLKGVLIIGIVSLIESLEEIG
jgi:hypothetical protein